MKTLLLILLLPIMVGCSSVPTKKESVFIPHELPVVYSGKAVNMECLKCQKCLPDGGNPAWVTAMYCLKGCCNTATHSFVCKTTGESFDVSINECDWIVWGYFDE